MRTMKRMILHRSEIVTTHSSHFLIFLEVGVFLGDYLPLFLEAFSFWIRSPKKMSRSTVSENSLCIRSLSAGFAEES